MSKIVTKNIDRNFKDIIFIMASEPSINGRKKIETLQKEFTQKFPYLTLVFLDKDRRPIDISKSLSEVRQVKGADISIIASLKVNTLEMSFLENFGLAVEVVYKKSGKVDYTKDNVDKTLNELNKWCEENECQPFNFKKSFTGNTFSSVQEQLFEAIKGYYPNAEAKKINKDNYLDIYIPEINKKRGTHLFFNTAKDGIKVGFYCRDEEFVENVLSNSSNIEKYSQGFRILNNPLQNDVDGATNIALSFIEEIIGEQNERKEKEIKTDAILKEKGSEVDEQFELSAFEYLELLQRYQEKEEEEVVEDEEDYDDETEEEGDDDEEELYDEETEEDVDDDIEEDYDEETEEEGDEDEEGEEDEEEIDDTKVEFEDYTVIKYGFIDKKGNQVIPCIYDSVNNFDGGIARVQQNEEWFFIDKKGNSIFKNRDIETSSEPSLLKEKKNNLYGLIDLNGNQILDFKYDKIDDFSKGFAKVKKNNKIGYINKKGIEIIACKYDYGYGFVNGFVNVTLDDKKMILTDIGEVISNSEYDEVNDFNEGLCKVGLENKYGFIDQKGKMIVPLIYDKASNYSNGYSCVAYEGKKLFIDKFGKNSLKTNYDDILPFSDGLARVTQKHKYGFIDVNGIEVIKCIYDDAYSFSNGVAEVKFKEKKQLIDKTGNVLFNEDFDFIGSFQEDFVKIRVDSLWGFIDSKGNKLTEIIYEHADSFSNGLAAVKMDEKWGYINTLGKEVISFEYESASSFKEDLARVSQTQIVKREKFNGVVLTNNYPVNSYDDIQKLKDIIVKDFKQIRFISKNLQENENAIKELIFLNNKIFPYLPVDIKNKETIIKIAIEAGYYDESFIEYIDINNKELLEKIISKAPLYFKLTPESSKSVELTRLAITKCDEIEFEDLPKSIQSNLGFFEDLLVTIRNNTSPFRDYDKIYVGMDYAESIRFGYVPLFCNNRDFILKYGLITNASDDISQNREFCFQYHNKWNNSFERIIYANPALADDIEFIRLGLSYDMANFRNLKDNYSNNKELLDFAVKNGNGRLSIRNIPESLLYIDEDQNKADINLLTHIVENNNYEIIRVPEVIRHNPEYAKSLIWAGRKKTNILYYAPKFLRKDREFVKALFKINPISLVFADSSILSDYSFMCDIIKNLPIIIKFCSKALQQDKKFILDAVKKNGLVYKYITEVLKADPEVYWAALKQNVDCFAYLPSSVQGIQSVLEYVSLKNGSLIDKCHSKVKSKQIKFNAYLNSENNSFKSRFSISKSFNEDISDNELLSVLKNDATQIIFLTEQFLSQDRQRLLEILKYSPYPLQFKSCRNILNQNELNQFIKENSWFFKYLDETEKSDISFIKEMLSINGLLIQYLSNEQKQDLELVKIALKQSTNACSFLSLKINWETPEAKSIAIELLTQDPSQISYFIHLDDLRIRSNVDDFFFHAFALDVSVINLFNPTRVSTDYSTTPWFNSNVYGSNELSQDELVLGMNQDGKFFNFDPIFNISTNIDIAISHGRDFNWEGLFNQFDEIELIETAFKYFPNEDTYKALENKIGKKIESQEYINPITISETPNLYTLISKEAQGLLDNAIAFIRAESELDYSEKFEQLPPSFKTNKIFLDSISALEITFEILDAFFDKKILHDEHFISTYLKVNYPEYINLPENLQTNRNIALAYGINSVKTRFTYDTELKLNAKFKKDKSLLIEISSKNEYNNFTIDGELLSDHKFLFEIIKFQPQLIKSISKDSLNSKLIIDVLKININAFDYLEPKEMLIQEVFDYVVKNDPSKFQKWKYNYTMIELVENLKSNPNIIKVINFIDSDTTIEIISDFHPITTKVFNGDGSSAVSDIGTLYHVNGYCEFTLGYDRNCYLSEDVAGVIDYEVINAFLESNESWSDYIWSESWHDYDSIYYSYGIIEPATDLKLPNEEIVDVKLKYERPECDKFLDCFNSSELGDFVQIASSDEKSYSWEGWKRYKLEFAPGIFDVNKISVEFEGDIVSGYSYNYSEDRSDDFEEISDYLTTGKGFTVDLYFNNGKALISVDSDELKEALDSAGIEYDEHERLKEFCEKFYQNKTE
jgi:hypothetical protein